MSDRFHEATAYIVSEMDRTLELVLRAMVETGLHQDGIRDVLIEHIRGSDASPFGGTEVRDAHGSLVAKLGWTPTTNDVYALVVEVRDDIASAFERLNRTRRAHFTPDHQN